MDHPIRIIISCRKPNMIQRVVILVAAMLFVSLCAGCGFHLRQEATLPANLQRMYINIVDPLSPLAKDLARALPRSGVVVVDKIEPGVAVLEIPVNAFHTDVLSVSGRARANEYTLRYHVEFVVKDAAGTIMLPEQTVELSRTFTFDATQAIGISAETDLLTAELQREMVQSVMRRLETASMAQQKD